MQHRTIKQARKELKEWGSFWRSKRYGVSGSISITQVFIESKRTETLKHLRKPRLTQKGEARSVKCKGVDIPTDVNATETRSSYTRTSESIFVPLHLSTLDEFIESLSNECKQALKNNYILDTDTPQYWLDLAERLVMNR